MKENYLYRCQCLFEYFQAALVWFFYNCWPIKGIVSGDEYFLSALKNQIITFCMQADGFHKIWLPFLWRKLKIKFLLVSMKTFTNSENPSKTLFQETCFDFQAIKVVPKAACDYEGCSESQLWHSQCRKLNNDSKSRSRNSPAAFGTIFRISRCFKRSKQKV